MVINTIVGSGLTIPVTVWDAEWGERISGATGLDSKISINKASFVACINELTEIDATGEYYLDLTEPEIVLGSSTITITTTTVGAKIDSIYLYVSASGSSGGPTVAEIADGVWDEIITGVHNIPDSAGVLLSSGSNGGTGEIPTYWRY